MSLNHLRKKKIFTIDYNDIYASNTLLITGYVKKIDRKEMTTIHPYLGFYTGSSNGGMILGSDKEYDGPESKILNLKKEEVKYTRNFKEYKNWVRKLCSEETKNLNEYLEKSHNF